jgi:hypothetical protein
MPTRPSRWRRIQFWQQIRQCCSPLPPFFSLYIPTIAAKPPHRPTCRPPATSTTNRSSFVIKLILWRLGEPDSHSISPETIVNSSVPPHSDVGVPGPSFPASRRLDSPSVHPRRANHLGFLRRKPRVLISQPTRHPVR